MASSEQCYDLSFSTQFNSLFSMPFSFPIQLNSLSSLTSSWADLPEDLLELIFKDLTDFFDLLRCKTICHSWRSATKKVIIQNIKIPLLLIPSTKTKSQEYAKLLSTTNQSQSTITTKLYTIHSPKRLAQTCCQSSYHGWLLMADIGDPSRVYLYNPISRFHVQLPLLPPEREYPTPLRFMMTCSPDDPNCSILVLFDYLGSHNGCVCKPGDNKWRKNVVNMGSYEDMIYYNGELYAIDKYGTLKKLKYGGGGGGEDFFEEEEVAAREVDWNAAWIYLVESDSGDLVMVVRQVMSLTTTVSFKAFKLNWRKGVWEEVNNFGDRALLLAHNDSVFVHVGNLYKTNCIYFVDDFWVGDHNSHTYDYGVYELGNHKIEMIYPSDQMVFGASFYRWFNLH
ncbi:hypothetical protein ACSBR2_016650 [Camellia fascicularis]